MCFISTLGEYKPMLVKANSLSSSTLASKKFRKNKKGKREEDKSPLRKYCKKKRKKKEEVLLSGRINFCLNSGQTNIMQ